MFFSLFKKPDVKKEYDERLLDLINQLKEEWDHAQKTQDAVADRDSEIEAQRALAKRKYFFIYREARIREVKNTSIQPSVINYDRFE